MERNSMSDGTSFERLMLVTDGAASTKSAEEAALKIALRDKAELIIADTIRIQGRVEKWLVSNSEQMYELLEKEKSSYLEFLAKEYEGKGVKHVSTALLHGPSSDEITREVIRSKVDLLVRYRKGPESRQRGLFGRTAMNLLRVCPCPMFLVADGHEFNKPKVLACVDICDHDEVNQEIINKARRINGNAAQDIGVLYCWSIFGHQMIRRRMNPDAYAELVKDIKSQYEDDFAKFLERFELDAAAPGVAMEFGNPETVIAPYAKRNSIDIVVMATEAPSAISTRLLGSTIENVIDDLPTSLLAVKPPGFVSPIHLNDQAETQKLAPEVKV